MEPPLSHYTDYLNGSFGNEECCGNSYGVDILLSLTTSELVSLLSIYGSLYLLMFIGKLDMNGLILWNGDRHTRIFRF